MAIGVVPVASLPLAPLRRGRIRAGMVGVVAAAALLVGALLAQWPPLAVAGILVLAPLAAHVSVSRPPVLLALTLALPLMAVGFSYPGFSAAAPLAGALLVGARVRHRDLVALAAAPSARRTSTTRAATRDDPPLRVRRWERPERCARRSGSPSTSSTWAGRPLRPCS